MNTENNNTELDGSAQQKFDSKRVRELIWKTSLTANEKLVLLAIAELSDDDDGVCVATRQKIATMCGLSDGSAVSRVTTSVSKKGCLVVVQGSKSDIGSQLPNTYKITIS